MALGVVDGVRVTFGVGVSWGGVDVLLGSLMRVKMVGDGDGDGKSFLPRAHEMDSNATRINIPSRIDFIGSPYFAQ